MGVVLVDLGDDDHSMVVNNAGFRAVLEILWPLPIVEEARRERLQGYWGGVEFTETEARALGNEIIEHHINGVDWLSDVFHRRDSGRTRYRQNRFTIRRPIGPAGSARLPVSV